MTHIKFKNYNNGQSSLRDSRADQITAQIAHKAPQAQAVSKVDLFAVGVIITAGSILAGVALASLLFSLTH